MFILYLLFDFILFIHSLFENVEGVLISLLNIRLFSSSIALTFIPLVMELTALKFSVTLMSFLAEEEELNLLLEWEL